MACDSESEIVAVIVLNECAAVYAGGKFGEITELYVKPSMRSAGIGAQLMAVAAEFGKRRNWPFLEVGTSDVNAWPRTLNFYKKQGFHEIGVRLEYPLR